MLSAKRVSRRASSCRSAGCQSASSASRTAAPLTLARFPSYAGAQHLVDRLADAKFPVERMRIVGNGIRTVETVTGRMTKGRAALYGAGSGAWFGLFIGLLFGLFTIGPAWIGVLLTTVLLGAVFGAIAGFGAGLLHDMGTFGTLGFTALLYTLAGYWIGRYGETTGRDRAHAPLLSVAVVTILYAIAALALHFMLGQYAPARTVLVDMLAPTILLNLVVTIPVFALCRRLLTPPQEAERAQEVPLLG